MVMMTRSRRRACQSCSGSEGSHQNMIPPWCSSAKPYQKTRQPSWEAKSSCDLRENIWEYLHRNEERPLSMKRTRKKHRRSKRCMKVAKMLTFTLFCLMAVGASIWLSNNERRDNLMTKLLPYTKLISLSIRDSSPVSEECCFRMKYLAEELYKAQQALRNTQRMKRTMLLASHLYVEKSDDLKHIKLMLISDAKVTKGKDTEEWGGKVALWGIVPLWRAAPPPDTVLSLRRPVPADCWPFSGSIGQLNFELKEKDIIHCMSIEHVRPDTARSSPNNFALYGVLENGTWIKTLEAEYKYQGPARQYFPLLEKNIPMQKLVFQVLSNHGNPKYTCLYRVQFYRAD